MIGFVLYVIVAGIMAAVMGKLWDYKPKSSVDISKLGWVIGSSIFWPATAPAIIAYALATKVVDKFTKV